MNRVVLAVTGLWCFGFSAANPSAQAWAGLLVGSGMQAAGLTMVPSIGFNYVLRLVTLPNQEVG